jgi:heat shock protein 5
LYITCADPHRLILTLLPEQILEAEEFAEQDKLAKDTVDARNALEGYAYNMKNQVNDNEKLGSKISDEDKETIEDAVKNTIEWLDDNRSASTEEYSDKQKELEGVCNPIVSKLYQQAGGAGGSTTGDDDLPDHDDL